MKRTKISRYVYNFKRADFVGLRETLLHTPFEIAFDCDDIDQCWEKWRDLFLTTAEMFIPKCKVNDAGAPKWIDGEIIKLSKHKSKLWKKAKRTNLLAHWEDYRKARSR